MKTNTRNGISIVLPMPLEHSLIQVVGITNSGAYLEAASNVIPFASPARSVFIRNPASPLYLTVATLMEKITGAPLCRFTPGMFWGRDFRYVGPALPVDQSNDRLMGEFCHRTVSTIWHYHGGCLVGKVVDRNFRVIGINALRVVDGSIFTVSLGTNPQAILLMFGRSVFVVF
ncbi:unnamed protein product [Dovyalis caffra]|uniref:Glucose-methanol-choline oxidoreductase C-terminal domain-containing protein n=1 Tax=Dovyalis caffra TaxID=77055 RepID=A0AAV1QW82_9ROSI|nr:unnamed protein product [Dovyalis caffra]